MEKPRDFIEHRQTEVRAFDRGGGREGGEKKSWGEERLNFLEISESIISTSIYPVTFITCACLLRFILHLHVT